MVYAHNVEEELAFARKAAEHFAAHPKNTSYSFAQH